MLVAYAMYGVAICFTQLERAAEAGVLSRLALVIKHVMLCGWESMDRSYVLHAMAGYTTRLEQARWADYLFRQALAIGVAGFETEDEQGAHMVYELARLWSQLD